MRFRLLRRHGVHRPNDGTGRGVMSEVGHQPEVEEHDAMVAGHQDVGRFDVAMDLARLMEVDQDLDQLRQRRAQPDLVEGASDRSRGNASRRRQAQRARFRARAGRRGRGRAGPVGPGLERTDVGEKVDSIEQLHGEKPLALLLDQLAQSNQMRVLQIPKRAKLSLEPQDRVRVERPDRLERDPHPGLSIEGLVAYAHTAGTQLTENLKAPQTRQSWVPRWHVKSCPLFRLAYRRQGAKGPVTQMLDN